MLAAGSDDRRVGCESAARMRTVPCSQTAAAMRATEAQARIGGDDKRLKFNRIPVTVIAVDQNAARRRFFILVFSIYTP